MKCNKNAKKRQKSEIKKDKLKIQNQQFEKIWT